MNICCDSLFENGDRINDFNGSNFGKILRVALENNFVNFDCKIFMNEKIWLNDCPKEYKAVYYRGYVDGIFALFHSPSHLEKFTSYQLIGKRFPTVKRIHHRVAGRQLHKIIAFLTLINFFNNLNWHLINDLPNTNKIISESHLHLY